MNDLYANEWSQFTNHFKPTFLLLNRENVNGKTKRTYEARPQSPYQRIFLASLEIPETTPVSTPGTRQPGIFCPEETIEVKLKSSSLPSATSIVRQPSSYEP